MFKVRARDGGDDHYPNKLGKASYSVAFKQAHKTMGKAIGTTGNRKKLL